MQGFFAVTLIESDKMKRRHWRARLLLRGAGVALSVFVTSAADAAHVPIVGEAAPSFLGYGLDSRKVLLETYKGKVVVISFWATWCPPCRQEMPILENIQRAGKGAIQVVAINTETRDTFRRTAKALTSLTLQLTNDESERAFSAYGVKGLPHLVVIGRDMHIISVREGYGPDELDDVATELNAALRAPQPEAAAPNAESKK